MEDAKKIPINLSPFTHFNLQQIKGWLTDFIIAGEFIHDVLTDNEKSNIDFYIFTEKGFHTLLEYFSRTYSIDTYSIDTYTIKTHYINIKHESGMNINLINAFTLTPIEIINKMEVDILRTFYDGETIYQFIDCEGAIESQQLHANNAHQCCPITILKAIDKGYEISREILEELGIKFNDRPISPDRLERNGEYDNHYDLYIDSMDEYLHTTIIPTKEQMDYLHETKSKENCKGITVNDLELAKCFLPYIYKNSIRNVNNINCGCFELNFTEMIEAIHLHKPKMPVRPVPLLPEQYIVKNAQRNKYII
jgi:hypothetical protein